MTDITPLEPEHRGQQCPRCGYEDNQGPESGKRTAEPRLVERARGGWLALSPEGCSIKIGVTAPSASGAVAAFGDTMARWEQILGKPPAE